MLHGTVSVGQNYVIEIIAKPSVLKLTTYPTSGCVAITSQALSTNGGARTCVYVSVVVFLRTHQSPLNSPNSWPHSYTTSRSLCSLSFSAAAAAAAVAATAIVGLVWAVRACVRACKAVYLYIHA